MSAELVVLGAGSILPRPRDESGASFGPAGYALLGAPDGSVTLLDCGPGSLRALGPAGIALRQVTRVVLSHFHPDHCLDAFALLFARRNPDLAGVPPLTIVGPRGLNDWLAGGRAAFGRWLEDERLALHEVEPTSAARRCAAEGTALEWTSIATGHTPHALAWRVAFPDGTTLVYSGDSGEVEALTTLARGADLFVCECSFADEHPQPHHLTPSGAARIAKQAGVGALLLTHFYPGLDPRAAASRARATFPGPIATAFDGSRHLIAGR